MSGDRGIGDAKKTLGNNSSDFEAIEVLPRHLCQDSLQCVQDSLCSKSAKERYLDFCRHKEEVPSRGMDLAIKSEAIQRLDQSPIPQARLTLEPKKFRHLGPLLHQNCADLYRCWHGFSRQNRLRYPARVNAVTTVSNSETNSSVALPKSTSS